MSPPAVVTESSDVQPEQPAAAAAVAEELEKKLQVRLSMYDLVIFFCHGVFVSLTPGDLSGIFSD